MNKGVLVLLIATLAGCASSPTPPTQPDGKGRVNVNSSTTIAEVMAAYYRAELAKKAKAEPARVTVKLPVGEVLDKYVPAEFKVYSNEDVDLDTVVEYEASRPWIEGLGRALTDAGIEMTADLDQKLMTLKVAPVTIADALNTIVPMEYVAYSDDAVRMDTRIKLDRKKSWMEALGKALSAVDVVMTVNVDKKLVLLKPRPAPKAEPAPPDKAIPRGAKPKAAP